MTSDAPLQVVPVYVVVPPRVLLLDVAGPIEVLRKANLEQSFIRFAVIYIGPSQRATTSIGLELTGIEALPHDLPAGALVVIAGSADVPLRPEPGSHAEDAMLEAEIVGWLARAVRPGIRLVTICSGALLAARAGLLDGVPCTTHHACVRDLVRLAPAARVLENRLYVDDGERLTSAGITAGIDLMLHIVAQSAGHACAVAVARYLVIYLRRGGGDPQISPWFEGRNHLHPAVHRAQDAIAADPARAWSVGALARVAACEFAQPVPAVQRAFRHERHRLCQPHAGRGRSRAADGFATRHGERGRTCGLRIGPAVAASLGPRTPRSAEPDAR